MKKKGLFTGMILGVVGLTAIGWPGNLAEVRGAEENISVQEEGVNEITYHFAQTDLKLPADWKGRYEAEYQKDSDSVVFYHKASREAGTQDGEEGCGILFTLCRSENYDFMKPFTNYYLVGSNEKEIYYITIPGDMHGYSKDEEIAAEWLVMAQDVTWIYKNAETEYPGAPMRTTATVNFREDRSTESEILDVIPVGSEIWVIGNFSEGWAEVNYNGESGYVKEDYLEFTGPANGSGEDEETDKNEKTGEDEELEENEIPSQGFTQCMLYDIDGGEIIIKQADDGYWYDENGVCYGYWTEILIAGEAGVPISDENGKLYYWTAEGHDGNEIPLQGAFSAMMYDKDGNSVQIHLNGDYWYDEDNVCYGSRDEVDEAGITGSPVTNENGKIYYWTCPD